MSHWISLNGSLVPDDDARISPYDRGFTLADGVFETMRAHGTEILWLESHIQRLQQGAKILGIHLWGDEIVLSSIVELLGRAEYERSAVRLTVTRGPSRQRGLWPPGEPVVPTVMVTASELPAMVPQRLVIARSTRRNQHSPLSRIKSLAYGDNLLARREALERDATDALMLNGYGNIACTTIGNIFFKLDERWTTPPLGDGVLPGLARDRLISLLNAVEYSLAEVLLPEVTAAFISNSLGCAPVTHIEGRQLKGDVDESNLLAIFA
jgi:branched-chain amino acid aminotransferase